MDASSTNDTQRVAIVDPALGRTGVHNRAFAELLLAQAREDADFGIWCNTSIDDELRERLTSRGVAVQATFAVDFYRVLHKDGGVAEHWEWIQALASQYRQAFEGVLARWPDVPVRVLHHTVSWEHATALSLALRLLGARGDQLDHVVLLMYSPGMDGSGRTHDAPRRHNFQLAFRALDTLPNVHLYAGCSEHASAYATLLQRAAALPVHPCFIGDWRQAPPRHKPAQPGHERVVLYLGEIKQEKGFLDLPDILRAQLKRAPATRRFVIQFVEARKEAARRVLTQLQQIAEQHPNVEVHHGFWPDTRLQQELVAADILHLDYDARAYAHKTSGLLWLAAWYKTPVVVPPGTWLFREARRLGMAILSGTVSDPRMANVDSDAVDVAYRVALFAPFWQWLQHEAAAPCRTGSAPRRALARRTGVDVVVFWKQNDSTLYGRRIDMVVRYLASRPDIRRVIVVDAAIGQANLERLANQSELTHHGRTLHDRTLQKLAGQLDAGKVAYKVYVCPLEKFRFREDGSDRPRFIEGYIAYLQQALAAEGVDPRRSVFWIYPRNFHAPTLLRKFSPARVVVDIVDNDRAWPGVSDTAKRALTDNLTTLLRSADMAFANCEPVRESVRDMFPDTRLVPNGCDLEPPRVAPHAEAFRSLARRRGRVIGFVGNLEAKIDIALLHKVAERFDDCHIVLIGSTHANPKVRELVRHANVSMPGVVPYEQLDAWLRRFDVGLVPHREMDLTRYMNPLKVYTYLSCNVPVVATAVPNIDEGARGLLQVAPTHEQFLDAIHRVLTTRRPPKKAFRTYAERHSWASRLKPHLDALLRSDSRSQQTIPLGSGRIRP